MANKMTPAEHLTAATGTRVRLVNRADVESENGVQIHTHGILHAPDDDGFYTVIIGQDPDGHGTNSISFKLAHLETDDGIFRQPSGIYEITLR